MSSVYNLRLDSDEECIARAVTSLQSDGLTSAETTIEGPMYGSASTSSLCFVCNHTVKECPGHVGVLDSVYAYPNPIAYNKLKMIISTFCVCCGQIPIPNIKDVLKVRRDERVQWVRKAMAMPSTTKALDGICPHCKQKLFVFKIRGDDPIIQFAIGEVGSKDSYIPVSPNVVMETMQFFTQVEELGFSESFHPKNFLSKVITIIPNKLRVKSEMQGTSEITSHYKDLITNVIPVLQDLYVAHGNKYPTGENEDSFKLAYSKLLARIFLIQDSTSEKVSLNCLAAIGKKDRNRTEMSLSLLSSLKGKMSWMQKGPINTRHDCSVRTVANGITTQSVMKVAIPADIAGKLSIPLIVYDNNVDQMKQLVAASSMHHKKYVPRVISVMTLNGNTRKITYQNAVAEAASIEPGYIVFRSLANGDMIQVSRFPCVREESVTSHEVYIDEDGDVMLLPISNCGIKMADFDGDEIQGYVPYSSATVCESLLLHSPMRVAIGHKDGLPAIIYSADAPYGIRKMNKDNDYDIFGTKACVLVREVLPKDFLYKDDQTTVTKSSFKGKIDNTDMLLYLAHTNGTNAYIDFIDATIQMAYRVNELEGNTLGAELRIPEKKRKGVMDISNEIYENLCKTERSSIPNKEAIQLLQNASYKQRDLMEAVAEACTGTALERNGYILKFQSQIMKALVHVGQLTVDGNRVRPKLASNSRTCAAFHRYSVDSKAYGFVCECYVDGIGAIGVFYENMEQRIALYVKGVGTAKQGYAGKRLGAAYGSSYIDANGCVITDEQSYEFVYGSSGADPRRNIILPLPTVVDTDSAAIKVLNTQVTAVHERYKQLTSSVTDNVPKTFSTAYNYDQYVLSNCTAGETPKTMVDTFIQTMKDVFCPPDNTLCELVLSGLTEHELYFRHKLSKYNLTQSQLDFMINQFEMSLADTGDTVGAKASLSTSEPLTQASLHAIHAAVGGVEVEKIVRPSPIGRFDELHIGAHPKSTVVSIILHNPTRENTMNFANEQETFYIKDIFTCIKIEVSQQIDPKVIEYYNTLDFSNLQVSFYSINMMCYVRNIANYNLHIASIVEKMMLHYPMMSCVFAYPISADYFVICCYFNPDTYVSNIVALVEEFRMKKPITCIHGGLLSNCFVSECTVTGDWMCEANEVITGNDALESLICLPEVDASRGRTSNIELMIRLYGLCEGNVRLYEESIYTANKLGATKDLLPRHYKLISDYITSRGGKRMSSSNSLLKEPHFDKMRGIAFEFVGDFIRKGMIDTNPSDFKDPTSAQIYGKRPGIGSGVSEVVIDFS